MNEHNSMQEQQELSRRIKLTNLITIGQAAGATLFGLLFLGIALSDPDFSFFPLLYPTFAGLTCLPAVWLTRGRRVQQAGYVLVSGVWVAIAGAYLTIGAFRGPIIIVFLWPIIVASMLTGLRAGIVFTAITAIFHGGVAALELTGRFTPLILAGDAISTAIFICGGGFIFFFGGLFFFVF